MGRRNEYRTKGGDALRLGNRYGGLQVTLCDPYLSALEAFAWTRYTNRSLLYFTFTVAFAVGFGLIFCTILVVRYLVLWLQDINRPTTPCFIKKEPLYFHYNSHFGRFLSFCTVGNRNEYFIITRNLLT